MKPKQFSFDFVATVTLITILTATTVQAQPPGRGPFGRGPGGPGPGPGFDPSEMLKRLDSNGNGLIEPGEAQGPARYMVQRMAERLRMDPNQPIPVSKVKEMIDQRRGEEEQRRAAESQRRAEAAKKDEPLVPGFGVEEDGIVLVPGFNLPDDSPLLSKLPLEKRYDSRILDRVKERMREYDKNGDGGIDKTEMTGGRWYGDPLKEYDLDGDGKLNKVEMAERYADRYGNSLTKKKSSSSSSSSKKSSPSSSSSSSSSAQAKLRSYAQSLMKQYDKNNNGVIDREEWGKMPKPERYNRNRDHIITMDELIYGASNFAKSSSSSSKSSKYSSSKSSSGGGSSQAVYRTRSTEDRLRKLGLPSSFISDDTNADGQLEMAEFATSWTDSKVAEFKTLDLNGDWVITPQEWLTAEEIKRASRSK